MFEIPFKRQKEEEVYGGEIHYSNYDGYEKKYSNIIQENGIGRGSISKWTKLVGVSGEEEASYCPVPFYFTNSGKSFGFNDYLYSEFEATKELFIFRCGQEKMISISIGDTVSYQYKQPYQLPEWSLGTILGIQGGTEEVIRKTVGIKGWRSY